MVKIVSFNLYQSGMLKDVTTTIPCTFHDYGKTAVKIDYIYMSKQLAENVCETGIWEEVQEGVYLSDHYPVYVIYNDRSNSHETKQSTQI